MTQIPPKFYLRTTVLIRVLFQFETMSDWLPPAMAAWRPQLGSVVASIEAHAPYGAVLLSSRQGLRITVDNREEQVIEQPPTAGTVLTEFDGATVYELALGSFNPAALTRAARELVGGTRLRRVSSIEEGPERHGDWRTTGQIAPDSLSIQDKLDRCRELHQRARGRDDRIANVQVVYDERGEYSVFRTRAADLSQRVQRLLLYIVVVVGDKDATRYNVDAKFTTAGWEALSFTDEELQALVGNAIALLSAERIEAGEYTVVTSPGVTGALCHESFGHGVEADMFLKERARATQYIDRMVGSPLVNIADDPSYAGGYGSYFFDDEGMLAAPTQIVENGVFRRGLTDLYSATALGIPRSANGRRQDYTRKAYARMSNTFFVPGTTRVRDLFAQVENGIYLEKSTSGVEDPKGWGIQVTCHYGHEIRHGKVTGRLFAPIGITGYVPELLQSITAVGDDWSLQGGFCGKGHKEIVMTGTGGPHLLLKAKLG